ncbi:carbamoyltransferase [Herbaspirillum seropedicae]|uniref:carbamoyltransferase family protein n=1 Tax=Herbaspirillum seropedicae TaxID=964 RepID=UPI003397E067
MKRNYVGLANSFHDSSIAIVDERGEVVFAEATERYLQHKRTIGIASDLFMRTAKLIDNYCDPDSEIIIATSWSDETSAIMQGHLDECAATRQHYVDALGKVPAPLSRQLSRQIFYSRSQLSMLEHPARLLEYELSQSDRWERTPIHYRRYEHHLTHAASGCFSSPFDNALCAVLDGFGERSSFACFHYEGGRLKPITGGECVGWSSLGIFYSLVCEACGFDPLSGEEWKVMGLAAYGQHDEALYAMLREMVAVDGRNIHFPSRARMGQLQAKLHAMRRRKGQSPLEFANLAYAGQRVFCEVLFAFLKNLHATGLSDNLVFSGGCALNSSANGKILANTPFRDLHVFSAPGDDGNAVGAALLAHRDDHPETPNRKEPLSPYLGSRMSEETLNHFVKFSGVGKLTHCGNDAPKRAAALLADNRVIGWIQGCAEFGPRALGNRSILADPRSPDIKERINSSVKFREEFRPFAPSILDDFGSDFFHEYHASPYMERTLRFRENAAPRVPGVVHADGTGRVQTIRQQWNPRFHALVSEFHRLTDIPLVLNTSFNVMGKPIAHSVEDALAVFFTSGLDAMFIQNILIEK